jgi:non-ribosomal peptide synthetase component F
VREVTLEGYAHQDLPFEKLVEELHPERNLGHHPVFQVLFALQNTPAPSGDAGAAPDDASQSGSSTAKFDLSLFMAETAQGLAGAFEYSTDLFDAPTIRGLAELLVALLNEIVADPDRRILDIPLSMNGQDRQHATGAAPAPHDLYAEDKFFFELPLQGTAP